MMAEIPDTPEATPGEQQAARLTITRNVAEAGLRLLVTNWRGLLPYFAAHAEVVPAEYCAEMLEVLAGAACNFRGTKLDDLADVAQEQIDRIFAYPPGARAVSRRTTRVPFPPGTTWGRWLYVAENPALTGHGSSRLVQRPLHDGCSTERPAFVSNLKADKVSCPCPRA